MPRSPLPTDPSLLPSPVPALPLAPESRPPSCSLVGFRRTRTASPSTPRAPPSVPIAPSAVRAPHAPPFCSSRAGATSLATETRRPGAPSKCAAAAALLSGLASACRCCAHLAADRAASAASAPPHAPCPRAAAAVLPTAKRRRPTLSAPDAHRVGGTRPCALLRGVAPSTSSVAPPPPPCRADSAPALFGHSSPAHRAPVVRSSPRAARPCGARHDRASPAAEPPIPRPPPGSSPVALPPA
ncbi:unnamed protein product [Closterium sp. Naga37s-1]|nr:unnamed protein product [Closterium sp. Naga37s-1]CAI5533760.1 unnamed protein product [Closterium sp. Naga37s-1]